MSNNLFYSKHSDVYFNLYNPPFCGQLLRICISEYEKKSEKAMPFALSFLILPIILNKELRETIIHNSNLHPWILTNYSNLQNFDQKVSDLIELTKNSLVYLLQTNAIKITDDGNLSIIDYEMPKSFSSNDEEINNHYSKTRFLGRWFSFTDDLVTIFSLLGVRP